MQLPYLIAGNLTGSVYSGSYLNEQDTALFSTSQSADLFFGYSVRDVTELSIFDTFDTPISWSVLNKDKSYKTVTLTYVDALNNPKSYTYNELNSNFIIHRGKKILLDPINDLSSSGVTDGSFKLSYIFSREMAGSSTNRLVINDISPSRTEIKLLPVGKDYIPYTSFCLKKFPVSDVSPILIGITQNCPYDQIYNLMYEKYKNSILFLQNMFFLKDDGSTIRFLKNLHEDFVKYTTLTTTQYQDGVDPTRVYRIQGIKSYFNNYLLQSDNLIANFTDIEKQFDSFVNLRIEQAFVQYSGQTSRPYKDAKQFCYDFFTQYFYATAVRSIQSDHQNKYFSAFKNVLNFGVNKYFPILTHDFLDERTNPTDPLTLILKFGSELPADISIKDECWVSNFGMAPFTFTALLQNPTKYKTLTIGPPNFGTTTKFINKENVNKLYSSEDLQLQSDTENSIYVNKEISKLNTDYSDFNNFVVFSSADTRINIFKNKMVEYFSLSSSLSTVEISYINSLSSSVTYPYYLVEKENIQKQLNTLISSFDGYESYLFDSENYVYNVTSKSFINTAFIEDTDISASNYDKYNRDSLVNNTPEYILDDATNNQDYLTFLSMVGHHFDNIYTYISALPIERQVSNNSSGSLPINTLKELLYSFGWNVDDIINSLDIDQVYLNSLNSATYDTLSAEQRLQIIWNRILVTLPGIYKTKGTEDCVKFLMACYGLPSSLISIREYGGTDSAEDPTPTYKLDEKTYMLKFSGIGDRIEGPSPSSTKTIEFKFAIESASYYQEWQRVSLFTLYPYQDPNAAWSIDLYKVPGQYTGKVALQMKSGSTGISMISDPLPIFNGEIFSVMLRRNEVSNDFEYSPDYNAIPIEYDLVVQRNEDGRKIFYSITSSNFYAQDNRIFAKYGRFSLSDGTYIGTLDKLGIWDVPLDDNDFEEHVNDLNSYGYSGSSAFQNLWVRLDWDYPQNVNTGSPSAMWIDNASTYYNIPNYYSSAWVSSSIVPTVWSASQDIIRNVWQTYYPTGSVDIVALNFPTVIDPNWSASYNCGWHSASVYPYHFREFEYQQDIDGSKFGPNKFKNKKIRKLDYNIEARFDANDRSTFDEHVTVTGESNQLGFFIDPQDSKNKDIVRYVGRNGIMELISDPRNLYSDKYYDLINKNYEYNSLGNKQTLFNEMLTVYKFYFDKSIFQAIKNIVPARANLFTGVVIEPTILERPKYQNRPIVSNINAIQNPAVISNLYHLTESVLWGVFGYDSGSFIGYRDTINLNYITYPNRIMPSNLDNGIAGYVTDLMDKVQLGNYPNFESFPRLWEDVGSSPANWPVEGIDGSTTYDLNSNGRFIVGPDQNSRVRTTDPISAGYNDTTHSILYYILKSWDKYYYYAKTGEYVRSLNPSENLYNSASVYLYKYIIVSEPVMREWVYWYNNTNGTTVNGDPSFNYFAPNYIHNSSTFKGTPNLKVSNVSIVPGGTFPGNLSDFVWNINPASQYFEIVSGYPRNHYTHKMEKFSKAKYPKVYNSSTNVIYVKGRNTIDDTINQSGINDGTYPVSSNNVSNVNVVNTGNVIQYVPTTNAGTLIPGAKATNNSNSSTGGSNTGTAGGGSSGGTSGIRGLTGGSSGNLGYHGITP